MPPASPSVKSHASMTQGARASRTMRTIGAATLAVYAREEGSVTRRSSLCDGKVPSLALTPPATTLPPPQIPPSSPPTIHLHHHGQHYHRHMHTQTQTNTHAHTSVPDHSHSKICTLPIHTHTHTHTKPLLGEYLIKCATSKTLFPQHPLRVPLSNRTLRTCHHHKRYSRFVRPKHAQT